MEVKLTEEFFKKRSYTRRYDHLAFKNWELIHIDNDIYTIQYHDIEEKVTRDEFILT